MKKKRVYYGWLIVSLVWITYLLNTAVPFYGASIINTRMLQAAGLSERVAGLASSAVTFFQFLTASFAGITVKKWGIRCSSTIGSLILCTVSAILWLIPLREPLYILIHGLLGAGLMFNSIVLMPCVINTWFRRKKSIAMAIVFTAGSVGGVIAPLITEALTTAFGWQSGWLLCLTASIASFLLSFLFLKERPEDVGEVIDGDSNSAYPVNTKSKSAQSPSSLDPGQVVRTSRFFALVYTTGMRNMIYWGVLSYTIIYAKSLGFSSEVGAKAISIMSLCSLLFRLSVGIIAGRNVPLWVLNLSAALVAAFGGLCMYNGSNIILLYLGTALAGSGMGMGYVLQPLLIADQFGDDVFPVIQGYCSTVGSLCGLLGPILTLAIANLTDNYAIAFLFLGFINFTAAIFSRTLRK